MKWEDCLCVLSSSRGPIRTHFYSPADGHGCSSLKYLYLLADPSRTVPPTFEQFARPQTVVVFVESEIYMPPKFLHDSSSPLTVECLASQYLTISSKKSVKG